ncbi:hypothetical protein [Oceanibaculum pacificum]|uniref:hypothetical protein n=1 Tax=Oceanibaculum pacificum TaxID=580166 RepID=UPI0012EE633D|nr:hypothetical protein [Oceanibaculum pacificum]
MDDKAERLAQALRQNLLKRKQQARGRNTQEPASTATEEDAGSRKKAIDPADDSVAG